MGTLGDKCNSVKALLIQANTATSRALEEFAGVSNDILNAEGRQARQADNIADREKVIAGREPDTIKSENINLHKQVEELKKENSNLSAALGKAKNQN